MDLKKLAELRDYANKFEGVEVRGKTIRINFYYSGVRCRESLKGLTLTKNNIKFASNKRVAVVHEIEKQTFDYRDHFPQSKRANLFSRRKERRLVKDAIINWLAIKEADTAPETYRSYKSKALLHVVPRWGHFHIEDVTKSEIERWMKLELRDYANKTINDILTSMRAIFNDACADGVLDKNPMAYISNLTVVKEPPDPFTKDEIKKIIEADTNRHSEVNAFEFSCWTGLSLSEMLAVAWEDVDLDNWKIRVKRSNVNGTYKIPKEVSRERIIDLLQPAIDVLKRQIEISYNLPATEVKVLQRDNKKIRAESIRFIFVKSQIRKDSRIEAFENDYRYRDRFFKAHLKKAKVRYRGPNHARHTYASQLLTAGVPKEWIAGQLGHTSTRMIDEHYGKWINEETPRMAEFVSELLGFSGPVAPPEPQKQKGQG